MLASADRLECSIDLSSSGFIYAAFCGSAHEDILYLTWGKGSCGFFCYNLTLGFAILGLVKVD